MEFSELVRFTEDSLKSSSKEETSSSLNKLGVSPGDIENVFSTVSKRKKLLIGGILVFIVSLILLVSLSYYFFF